MNNPLMKNSNERKKNPIKTISLFSLLGNRYMHRYIFFGLKQDIIQTPSEKLKFHKNYDRGEI